MTVQTHSDLPVAFAILSVPKDLSSYSRSQVLDAHMLYITTLTKQGIYATMQYFAPTFQIPLIVWYNHTTEELDQAMAPYLNALKNITDPIYSSRQYPTFLDMFNDQSLESTPIANFLFGGRLLPQSLFQGGTELKDVIDYYVAEDIPFSHIAFRLPDSPHKDRNAVSDAWRDSEGLLIPLMCVFHPYDQLDIDVILPLFHIQSIR